jgi:hypothetical protein
MYCCMGKDYKGDTWEWIQMDKKHTSTKTKTEQKLLQKTRKQTEHMKHTNTVCDTERDRR